MKYYTICFPGEYGQNVVETWSELQIVASYYGYWRTKMIAAGKQDMVITKNCIDDWCVVHWATETDKWG